jgi:hypothetical protein
MFSPSNNTFSFSACSRPLYSFLESLPATMSRSKLVGGIYVGLSWSNSHQIHERCALFRRDSRDEWRSLEPAKNEHVSIKTRKLHAHVAERTPKPAGPRAQPHTLTGWWLRPRHQLGRFHHHVLGTGTTLRLPRIVLLSATAWWACPAWDLPCPCISTISSTCR